MILVINPEFILQMVSFKNLYLSPAKYEVSHNCGKIYRTIFFFFKNQYLFLYIKVVVTKLLVNSFNPNLILIILFFVYCAEESGGGRKGGGGLVGGQGVSRGRMKKGFI